MSDRIAELYEGLRVLATTAEIPQGYPATLLLDVASVLTSQKSYIDDLERELATVRRMREVERTTVSERLRALESEDCPLCGGDGEINGRETNGPAGWVSDGPCPRCKPAAVPPPPPQEDKTLLRDWRLQDEALQEIAAEVGILNQPIVPIDIADAVKAEFVRLRDEGAAANKAAAEWRDALAAMQEQRDHYKTLAGIGVWHKDCRPNRHQAAETIAKMQATIDKLADTISELRAAHGETPTPPRSTEDGQAPEL